MKLFIFKRQLFNPTQLERLSNILDNAGQGFFVALILTPIVQGIDRTNPWVLLLGVIAITACWSASLFLAKKEVEK